MCAVFLFWFVVLCVGGFGVPHIPLCMGSSRRVRLGGNHVTRPRSCQGQSPYLKIGQGNDTKTHIAAHKWKLVSPTGFEPVFSP